MEIKTRDEIVINANRLVMIRQAIEGLNKEKDELEGYFLKLADEDLRNTKLKTVEYKGAGSNKVIATIAESLKVIYPSYFKKIFGEVYSDVVTEEINYKLSAPAKRMLSGLWLKNFTKETVENVINQISVDDKTKQVLLKKVKGVSFATDKKNLIAIAGLDEKQAEEYAYFIMEANIYHSFKKMMIANNREEKDEDGILDWINVAIVVEETPKITIEM